MTNKTRKGSVMNVEIAQRLAELRRERGFSQEDLASRLGLSRQAVSKWERAESAPDMGNLIALADLYEVTIDELLRVSPEVEEDMLFESQERAEEEDTAAAVEAPEPPKVVVEVNTGTPPVYQVPPPQPGFQTQVPPHVAGHQGFRGPTVPGPQQPIPPASSVPIAPTPQQLPKDPLRSFPYPLLCAVVFLLIGFFFGWWHPGWIIFLTIPFYYWIVNVLENDPAFQEWRLDRAQAAAELRAMSATFEANADPASGDSSSSEGGPR